MNQMCVVVYPRTEELIRKLERSEFDFGPGDQGI
jgi:hypothetical protein